MCRIVTVKDSRHPLHEILEEVVIGVREEHGKFVATDACHHISTAERRFQAMGQSP